MAGEPEVDVWGTGTAKREFLHVDDLADALLFLIRHYSAEEHINVGCGKDVTIAELASTVAEVVGYTGKLRFLPEKPDGALQKLLDVSRLSGMGWQPRIRLRAGLSDAYRWYLEHGAPATADNGNSIASAHSIVAEVKTLSSPRE